MYKHFRYHGDTFHVLVILSMLWDTFHVVGILSMLWEYFPNCEKSEIESSKEERDLGVLFHKAISFDPHVQNCVNKMIK